ncbi:MAG: hypothetical protein M1827_005634 [Pycnora praestabilis]|nr:MAG: hypothetical protein M1827_005634 [Pycnora praestabilis]
MHTYTVMKKEAESIQVDDQGGASSHPAKKQKAITSSLKRKRKRKRKRTAKSKKNDDDEEQDGSIPEKIAKMESEDEDVKEGLDGAEGTMNNQNDEAKEDEEA